MKPSVTMDGLSQNNICQVFPQILVSRFSCLKKNYKSFFFQCIDKSHQYYCISNISCLFLTDFKKKIVYSTRFFLKYVLWFISQFEGAYFRCELFVTVLRSDLNICFIFHIIFIKKNTTQLILKFICLLLNYTRKMMMKGITPQLHSLVWWCFFSLHFSRLLVLYQRIYLY